MRRDGANLALPAAPPPVVMPARHAAPRDPGTPPRRPPGSRWFR